jgi:hypothetical protein
MPDQREITNLDKTIKPKECTNVPLVPSNDEKIPAHSIILATSSIIKNQITTQEIFPCDLCSKEFPKEKARDVHKKKTHKVDNIKYTPAPVNHKSWFYCNQCSNKRKTEEEIEIHVNRIHKHMKRNLSEMKRGQIQRVGSVTSSPPQKTLKKKLMNSINLSSMQKNPKKNFINSETNTDFDGLMPNPPVTILPLN